MKMETEKVYNTDTSRRAYNSDHVELPNFVGDSTQRLVKFKNWAQDNTPGRCYTLEEIAGVAGVTRERIRQIEARGLKKLRHPEKTKHFDNAIATP